MAELYIHIPGGEQLSIVPEASSSQDWALMGDNKLSLSFQRYECLILPAGAWCEFDGVIFYLLQEYKPTMIHSHLWQYNVAFVDGASWLGVTTAMKTIDGEDAPLFTLTAPAIEHATIIVSNLNRRLGTTMWKVGNVIDTPNITIEYTGKYCGAVLQEIVDDQNTEWWVDGTTLNIGRAEFGSLIELGYRDGLLGDITVTQADNMSSYRTLYPVGSTRNILPTEYGHDRLQLPNGQKSVMMNPAGVAELVEEAAFAGIYPRYKGKVTGVSTSIGQSNDGSQYLIYIVADTAIPFNPNEYEMPGLVKRITFQSGELMGAEFEVNYNPASNEFELITQFQENGSQLPGGMLIPQVGDEYVVWNISMPAEYYPLAEQELLEAAESFAAASTRESNVYKVKLDYIDVQERGLSLRPGQKVRLHSLDYFPEQGYYDSRITRVTRPVNYPGEYTIDVSAVRVVGSLARLQTSLAAATTKVNSLSNTVQTVVQTVSNAVALTGNQRVQGVKNFVDGIRVNGSPIIEYHPAINTWLFRGNILAEGGMAAFSNIKGFTPSTITEAVLIDNRTIKRGADGLLYVDFDEGGSGGGSLDEEKLEEYLKPYAKTADVANTYATKSLVNAISTQLNDFLSGSDTDTIINKWSELETFLAGLAETDDLATILSGKANKATTLAGYGITDAYTKAEINTTVRGLDASIADLRTYANDTFVKLATPQSVTARHNFIDGLKINGLPIYNSQDDVVYIDANLVVRGGVTAWGTNEETAPNIFEGLPIDGTSIYWDNGVLKSSATSSGGINEEQLADYLTTNGYAMQSWVTGRGYITGITGTMVTNALGYTPYNSANFTKANIKSTLGISDWALASAKPSYTASEVGALMQDSLGTNADLDTILESKTAVLKPFFQAITGTNIGSARKGVLRMSYNGSESQLLFDHYNRLLRYRTIGKNPKDWATIAFTSDIPTALSQLTDDVVSGKYLSLAGGTISQSAYWSTKFKSTGQTSSAIAFEVANGNVGYLIYADGSKWQVTAQNWSATHTLLHSGNYSNYALPITGGTVNGDITLTNGYRLISPSGNIAGTRIFGDDTTNYRTILGTASVNTLLIGNSTLKFWKGAVSKEYEIIDTSMPSISFPKYIATGIGTTEQSGYKVKGNGLDATFGANDATGGAYIWVASYHALRFGTNGAERVRITPEGNVAIGGITASEKLEVYGNVKATSFIGSLKGNADSATKLANRVSLWGNDFDASASISGNIIGKTPTWSIISGNQNIIRIATAGTIITPYDKETGWVAIRTGAENTTNGSKEIRLLSSGNVAIGGTTASEKLHVYGNILATGGITAQNSSDRRLKLNLRRFNASKVLMSLGAVWEYEYIDSEVQKNHIYDGTHFGLIYQHVKGTKLDVMCHEREDGMGALNYLHPKFISLIAGATMENISEVEKLKRKIRHLEAKVKQLESRA